MFSLQTGGRSKGRTQKDENATADDVDLRLLVHQSQAGCIIGKGGGKVKELREVSIVSAFQFSVLLNFSNCWYSYRKYRKIFSETWMYCWRTSISKTKLIEIFYYCFRKLEQELKFIPAVVQTVLIVWCS